jgi:hypothetical protein
VDTKKVMNIIIIGDALYCKKSNQYAKDYKVETVGLIVGEGKPISELAHELGTTHIL